MTAQDILTRFAITNSECDSTTALSILNQVDEEILSTIPLRRTTIHYPLTANVLEQEIDETILRIWSVAYRTDPSTATPLTFTSIDDLDISYPGWRYDSDGSPEYFYTGADMTSGTLGVYPTSSTSTLLITNASNANPIQITTSTPHGLLNNDSVFIANVGGNTAANTSSAVGSSVTVTVINATNFTIPAAGNGAYTSGGIVLSDSSPILTAEVSQRVVLSTGTPMPLTSQIRDLYVSAMNYRYAIMRKPEEITMRKAIYESDLAKQVSMTTKRTGHDHAKIKFYSQRPNWNGGCY